MYQVSDCFSCCEAPEGFCGSFIFWVNLSFEARSLIWKIYNTAQLQNLISVLLESMILCTLPQCFAYLTRLPIASAIQVSLTIMACDDINPAKFWFCYLKALPFVFIARSCPDFLKWCKAGHLNGKGAKSFWPMSAVFLNLNPAHR